MQKCLNTFLKILSSKNPLAFLWVFVFCVFLCNNLMAQNTESGSPAKSKVLIPYPHLHESNVMWSKQIWRVMDLREKMNLKFYYPTEKVDAAKSLMQVIWEGVTIDETMTAYEDEKDGDLERIITPTDLLFKYNFNDTTQVENPANGNLEQVVTRHIFNPSDVKQFRLKEEWFFDKQQSVLAVRIIAICPVAFVVKSGEQRVIPMFWVYFPEARMPFRNAKVFNKSNDAEQRTYEEIFIKRKFGSYIYKESNVYSRRVSQYLLGKNGLLESEKIKEEIRNAEQDLWEY
jgi:gliding motility associated protien GldN